MSESNPYKVPGGHAALPRTGRFKAMSRSLGVSFAQVIAAVVVAFGCVTATSIAPRSSGYGDVSDGIPYVLAAVVLVPLSAMIAGPLVAGKLGLANGANYSLSVIVVVVVMSFALSSPRSEAANLLLIITVLTFVNLLIGFLTGLRRERTKRG